MVKRVVRRSDDIAHIMAPQGIVVLPATEPFRTIRDQSTNPCIIYHSPSRLYHVPHFLYLVYLCPVRVALQIGHVSGNRNKITKQGNESVNIKKEIGFFITKRIPVKLYSNQIQ